MPRRLSTRVGVAAGAALFAAAGLVSILAQAPPQGRQTPPVPGRPMPSPSRPQSSRIRFTDVTPGSGLRSVHASGGSGHGYYVEQLGSGAAFLDYDGNGTLDVFLAGGGTLPGYTGPPPAGNKLFRNNGNGTFTDATRSAGLATAQYTLGAAAADYDNDGHTDLYITTLRGNALFHNDGTGHFTNVTAAAGVAARAMSTGAAFFDYDGDGLLDLFVSRYMDYSLDADKGCQYPAMRRVIPRVQAPAGGRGRIPESCGPLDYPPTTNRLFHNNGDGTFADVTEQSGIGRAKGHGLGIAIGDFNEDGRPDVFVASDNFPNLLFMNMDGRTFRDAAPKAGVNVWARGKAFAGMGTDAADYDNDGHVDLFITNFEDEPSLLYRGRGDGTFIDAAVSSGVIPFSQPFVKWGARFADLDGDGLKDLFVVNGHVDPRGTLRRPGLPDFMWKGKGFAQEAQVYLNQTGLRFVDASQAAGPFFSEKHVARGAALGDFDNDGDWDALVTSVNESPVLLRNDSPAHRWAGLVLEGDGCNHDALGTRVRVTNGSVVQTMYAQSGGSYLSDHDHRLLVGLPKPGPATAEIRWPCGAVQTVVLTPGKILLIKELVCLLRKH